MMSWCNNTAVTMSTKSVSFKESEFVKRRIYVIKPTNEHGKQQTLLNT